MIPLDDFRYNLELWTRMRCSLLQRRQRGREKRAKAIHKHEFNQQKGVARGTRIVGKNVSAKQCIIAGYWLTSTFCSIIKFQMMHTMRDELKIDLEPELKIECTKVSGEWKKIDSRCISRTESITCRIIIIIFIIVQHVSSLFSLLCTKCRLQFIIAGLLLHSCNHANQ